MAFFRLLVTVSNWLNARQSEIFPEFLLKSAVKPIEKLFEVSLEMSRDTKKYFRFTFDKFPALVYTVNVYPAVKN